MFSGITFTSLRPLTTSASVSDFVLSWLTNLASTSRTSLAWSCNCSAAIAMSISRAAAAARRSWGAIVGVVRLPNVPMSIRTRLVSPITIRIELIGTCNSSATAWVKDVRAFWPTSTFPVSAVTVPLSSIWIQALISCGRLFSDLPRAPDSPCCWEIARPVGTIKSMPRPKVLMKSRRSRSNL